MKDKFKKMMETPWIALTFALSFAVVLYMVLQHVGDFLVFLGNFYGTIKTIVMGVVIAYVFNPFMVFLEEKVFKNIKNESRRHIVSVVLTFVVIIAFVVILFVMLIPSVVDGVVTIFNNRWEYAETVSGLLDKLNATASSMNIDITKLSTLVEDKVNDMLKSIPNNADSIIATSVNIGSNIFNTVIAFILAIYFLMEKKSLVAGIGRLRHAMMSEKSYKQHSHFFLRCHNILIRYVGCDLLDGLIVGVLNAVFMIIMGMSYTPLVSVLVGVTNLLPTFGPLIGGVLGAFILLMSNPWHSLWFIVFTIILQTLDGYFIKPKLFGNTLGVSPVWILITIIVGGKMFGILGVLLAIPAAAILTFIYEEFLMSRLEKNKARREEARAGKTQKSEEAAKI